MLKRAKLKYMDDETAISFAIMLGGTFANSKKWNKKERWRCIPAEWVGPRNIDGVRGYRTRASAAKAYIQWKQLRPEGGPT
jgi:hypothetical protein